MAEMQHVVPRVMAHIVKYPRAYYVTTLSEALNVPRPSVNRAVNMLSWRRWIDEEASAETNKGKVHFKSLAPSRQFSDDFHKITGTLVLALEDDQRQLYDEALDVAQAFPEQGTPLSNDRMAGYLGRAVMLGEQVPLEPFGWFDGFEGWRALIETQAHLDHSEGSRSGQRLA